MRSRLKSPRYLQRFLRIETHPHACGPYSWWNRDRSLLRRIVVDEHERHTRKQSCRNLANTYHEVQTGIRILFLNPCPLLCLNRNFWIMRDIEVFTEHLNLSSQAVAQRRTQIFIHESKDRPTHVLLS